MSGPATIGSKTLQPATTESIVDALRASEIAQNDLVKRLSAELVTFRNLTAELQLQNRHQAEVIERQQAIINRQYDRSAELREAVTGLLRANATEANVEAETLNSLDEDTARFHADRPPLADLIVRIDEPPPRPSERDVEAEAHKAVTDALNAPPSPLVGEVGSGSAAPGEGYPPPAEDDGAPIPEGIRRDREPGLLESAGRAAAGIAALILTATWPLLTGLA